MSETKPIPIIINPSSGKPQPILHTINETFRAHKRTWRGQITYRFGDATQFARQAAADGAGGGVWWRWYCSGSC